MLKNIILSAAAVTALALPAMAAQPTDLALPAMVTQPVARTVQASQFVVTTAITDLALANQRVAAFIAQARPVLVSQPVVTATATTLVLASQPVVALTALALVASQPAEKVAQLARVP